MTLRFSNETEITERDGVLHITVTVFQQYNAETLPSGYRFTEGVFHHHWRYKDGKLLDTNDKEFSARNEETAIVLDAVVRWEESKAKATKAGK